MKIVVVGTRGIPGIPGGVETHCGNLYPLIAAKGHDVYVITRSSYVQKQIKRWQNVHLIKCYSPRTKSFEAIVHTFLGLIKARFINPDLVHIHAVGPALLAPFARILGLKVVFTNHGPDYDRQKWGKPAKFILRLGEMAGGLFANEVIVISSIIQDIIKKRCKRESTVIYNGVTVPSPVNTANYLDTIGIRAKHYILAVSRFVPEKGLIDLIEAYNGIKTNFQLVIAGDADHETDYSRKIKMLASQNSNIILTGYITGEKLKEVFTNAKIFILPSYHEGLPIALLEALSYGLSVLVSDIPANCEVDLPEKRFFRCGDILDLQKSILKLLDEPFPQSERAQQLEMILQKYDWAHIADQTIKVYVKAFEKKSAS